MGNGLSLPRYPNALVFYYIRFHKKEVVWMKKGIYSVMVDQQMARMSNRSRMQSRALC